MLFSFSILVDINHLVTIVLFMHTVFSVWVPEAILFHLFIYFFYSDNYILSAVYLLVFMNLNLDKPVKVY